MQPGRYANFLITSGDIFDKETTLYENWVQGVKNVINSKDQKDIRGSYSFSAAGKNYELIISGEASKLKSKVKIGDTEYPSKIDYSENWLTLSFTDKEQEMYIELQSNIQKEGANISGKLFLPNGIGNQLSQLFALANASEEKKEKEDEEEKIKTKNSVRFYLSPIQMWHMVLQ